MARFTVEYQRCPGSPMKLAGQADGVVIGGPSKYADSEKSSEDDLIVNGWNGNDHAFRVVIQNGREAKVIITSQNGS